MNFTRSFLTSFVFHSLSITIRGAAGSEATVGSERYAITTGHITYERRSRSPKGGSPLPSSRLTPPAAPKGRV